MEGNNNNNLNNGLQNYNVLETYHKVVLFRRSREEDKVRNMVIDRGLMQVQKHKTMNCVRLVWYPKNKGDLNDLEKGNRCAI